MKKTNSGKGHPQPIRFDKPDEEKIREIANGIGVSGAEVVRMAVRFALPKFMSGEVSVKDLVKA